VVNKLHHKVRGVSPEAESLQWERFVEEVGIEPGVKEGERTIMVKGKHTPDEAQVRFALCTVTS